MKNIEKKKTTNIKFFLFDECRKKQDSNNTDEYADI